MNVFNVDLAAEREFWPFFFSLFKSLYNQQLAHQSAIFNSIRNQAYGGAGAQAGSGGYGGGSTGSYGGVSGGQSYGWVLKISFVFFILSRYPIKAEPMEETQDMHPTTLQLVVQSVTVINNSTPTSIQQTP